MADGTWTLEPCDPHQAHALAEALSISETTAAVLVRRGYCDPEAARAFLEGEQPPHDPFLLGDMRAACETILAAITAGKRICVHGDYDVDGICATALAVLTLRELGADVEWHLPSRFEEGYGVARATLARLAEDGCGLVLTVDCGITAVEEVAEARAAGLEVVVTDHHRPGETLPDCPIVATRPSDYPFPELCGTGVVYKLTQALALLAGGSTESPPVGASRHLDLVALATIADVVPLVDENRSLAISGLRGLARTQKPGLQALMRCAGVDPATVDSGSVGFRLAPRINAAGRLGHPGAALELLLTEDREEAGLLANRLEDLNRERQTVEERIVRAAIAQVEEWPEARRRNRAYVVADADWHEGVIGIVASRLVERYNRPVVLITGTQAQSAGSASASRQAHDAGSASASRQAHDAGSASASRQAHDAGSASASRQDETWKGSGRSIPAFDLHGALGACAEHLERYGGHRAAAGLSIKPENVDEFARAFAAQAEHLLPEDALTPQTRVDAIVAPQALTLSLAQELRRLAPFGLGNPEVTLLTAACELADLATVGDGKHLRFRVRDRGRDAGGAIAFGMGGRLDSYRRGLRYDVAFRLTENHWNGTVAPQLVVRRIFETPDRYDAVRSWFAEQWRLDPGERDPRAQAVFEELALDAGAWRSLLESSLFRAMLEEVPLAQAA